MELEGGRGGHCLFIVVLSCLLLVELSAQPAGMCIVCVVTGVKLVCSTRYRLQ